MNIVFLDSETLGSDSDFTPIAALGNFTAYGRTAPEETYDRIACADIAITNKVVIDRKVMEQVPNLRLICVAATGMNNIDLVYARERGIEVKNVAGYSTESVVQVTFSHVLYLLCQHRYYDTYAKTAWSSSPTFAHIGPPFYELAGKQWGIIGLGTIGRRVAEVARAFGCRVVYYSTSGKNIQPDIVRMELDDVLATSHIVTVHAPLNEQTHNLITYEKLQRLCDGAILVNMGRGGIVNEADLARILDERPLYAGLDVMSREPIDPDSPLLRITHKERLSLTPHIGWTSIEARKRLVQGIADNIRTFIQKQNARGDVRL